MFKFSLFAVLLFTGITAAQTNDDQAALQKAFSAPTDSARLELIQEFIRQRPASTMLPNAYAMKFQVYYNLGNDSGAYFSVKKYLSLLERSQLPTALNGLAFEFAQRSFFVDSAAVMIDSAIAMHGREEPVLLNTKALIQFRLNRLPEALTLQKKAVALLPANAQIDQRYMTFFVQLGFIQAESGELLVGLQKVVLGNILVPSQSIPTTIIDSILSAKNIPAANVRTIRDSLYREAVATYIRLSTDSAKAKSVMAIALARLKMFPETAIAYAMESYTASRGALIDERSGAAASLGLAYHALGRYADAEPYLTEASQFQSPNGSEVLYALADSKDRLGKKKEAFDVYVTGAVTTRTMSFYSKVNALRSELFPNINLDSLMLVRQASLLRFTPEEYKRPKRELKKDQSERIVLAELFTGSECKPCQASDIAFDYLIERYRANSLAILQYHLHVPAPDPFANEDTEKRSEYYRLNSTPTAVFGGTSVNTSGGSKAAAKNKFLLYSDIIDRHLEAPSNVTIKASSVRTGNVITFKATAQSMLPRPGMKLRIVLAEEAVSYTGANGIEHHKFVVRKMIRSADGIAFPSNGILTVEEKINVKTVQQDLEKYHTKMTAEFAKVGAKINAKKTAIDPKNLVIVAFAQDDYTREVLQAVTVKVIDKVNKK